MNKLLILLAMFASFAWASGGVALTYTWIGVASLVIFVLGYYFIAAEEKYHINKAKPALFIGTFIFMLIGLYYSLNGLDLESLHHEVKVLILEIAVNFRFSYL